MSRVASLNWELYRMITHTLFYRKKFVYFSVTSEIGEVYHTTSDVEWTARSVSVRNFENPSNGKVVSVNP